MLYSKFIKNNFKSLLKNYTLLFLVLLIIPKGVNASYIYCRPVIYKDLGNKKNCKHRFGNQFLAYLKAKWLSLQTNKPLVYEKFDFCELFYHANEDQVFSQKHQGFEVIRCESITESLIRQIKNDTSTKRFYEVHLGTEILLESLNTYPNELLKLGADKRLKKFAVPQKKLNLVHVDDKYQNVAIHIRCSGSYDLPQYSKQLYSSKVYKRARNTERDLQRIQRRYVDILRPLKVPPLQYYIDQMNFILKHLSKKPIYFHIFTNSTHPEKLLETLKKCIDDKRIKWGINKSSNEESLSVLEDIYSMAKFTHLIRSTSFYPKISEFVGNFKTVIYPREYKWHKNILVITSIVYRKFD